MLVGQPLPDRKQQAGNDVHVAFAMGWHFGEFPIPGAREGVAVGLLPVRLRQRVETDGRALHRPQQAHAALDRAVVEHQAGCRHLHRGAARLRIDEQAGAGFLGALQGFIEREGLVAVTAADGEHLALRAAAGMGVERATIGDDKAFGSDGLDAAVIGARCDGSLDLAPQQVLENGEQPVLQVDGEGQQAIEEGGDRRQLFAQAAVAVGEAETRCGFERLQRTALEPAGVKQQIELTQRRARVRGFEIVIGTEQALAAGLTLALGDSAQRIEPPGDGGEEALFGLHVGGDRSEQWRLRLVRPIRAAKPLNGGIGLPTRLEQIMDAQALVSSRQLGVIAAPGAAGVGKYQNPFLVVHERGGFRKIGRSRAIFHDQPIAVLP